ncbi:MAG: hypothetical protein HY924_16785 [Elusimicrobia bacterium]|nr:hypothetical protein [Elusimicrobiota bacterium]
MSEAGAADDRPLGLPWRLAGAVFLSALAWRAWFLWLDRASPFIAFPIVDAREYHLWASSIAAGKGLFAVWAHHSPIYPALLAASYSVFGSSPWPVLCFQALLGALTAAFCCLAAWRQRQDFWAAGAAGLAAALAWPFLYPVGQLLPQVLETFLSALALWLLSGQRTLTSARALAAGGSLGAVCSMRPQFLPAALCMALSLRLFDRAAGWKPVLALAVPTLGLSLAWGAVLSSKGIPAVLQTRYGLNLYLAGREGASGKAADYPGLEFLVLKQKAARAGAVGPSQDAFFAGEVRRRFKEAPAASAGLGFRRLYLNLSASEIPAGEAHPWEARGTVPLHRLFCFAALLAVGLPGLVMAVRREPGVMGPAAVFAAAGLLSLAAGGAAARYRAPLLPVLALGAGCLALRFKDALRDRRWRSCGLMAGACLASGFVSLRAGALAGVRPERDLGIALSLAARGGGSGAEESRSLLEAWSAEHPEDQDGLWHLGLVLIRSEDWSGAHRSFRRLTQQRGGDLPQLYGIVAWLSALEGRGAEAASEAQASFAGDPGSLEACLRAALYAKAAEPSVRLEDRLLRCPLDPSRRRPSHPAAEELAAVLLAASEGRMPRARLDLQEALTGAEEAYWDGWQMDYPAARVRDFVFRQRWPLTQVGPQGLR